MDIDYYQGCFDVNNSGVWTENNSADMLKIMTLASRIQQRMDELGLTQDRLAEKAGVSQTTIFKLTSGKSSETRKLVQIAAALKCRPEWLQSGEGAKELQGLAGMYSDMAQAANGEVAPNLSNSRLVPVVGTAQLGDNGFWSELEHPTGHGDGAVNAWTGDENAYAIRCRGNSMSPRIKDGEFVVVSPKEIPIPGDEVLIRHTDGRVMVKQFLYERDGVVHVMSVNESHPPQSFQREEIERFNLVVAILKRGMWVPP